MLKRNFQAGPGSEQPDLAVGVPVHCRGVGLHGLQRFFSTLRAVGFYVCTMHPAIEGLGTALCLGCTKQQEGIGRTIGAKRNIPIPPSPSSAPIYPAQHATSTLMVRAHPWLLPSLSPYQEQSPVCLAAGLPPAPVAFNLPAGPFPLNKPALNQVAPNAMAVSALRYVHPPF